jgi:peptidoglycan/xylan/chitin deacetylase (PgdA/CDA1 family)
MSLQHEILIITRPIQKIIREIGVKLGLINPNRLRVLLYHDIPLSQEDNLSNQLRWLKRNWNFVTPLQFEKMISGEIPIIGNNLLVTFDDGMLSNLAAAEKILNPLGIKAIFFVITEFIKIKEHLEARQFASDYLIPGSSINDIPEHWRNLQWSHLSDLIKQGHTIGHHTKMHTRLSHCRSGNELEEEIIISANEIEHHLSIEIKHFAYTFGDIDSFSKEALSVAKSQFSFVYSGLRGSNSKHTSPLAIRRDAAASQFPNEYKIINNNLLDAFLDGFADFRYKSSIRKLDSWTN